MNKELIVTQTMDLPALGEVFFKSGFFEDLKSPAQAIVKVLAGQEVGIPPFAALKGIHIIHGQPAIGAKLMAAMVKRSGKYNYRVMNHTDQVCELEFYEDGQAVGVSKFTADDAKRAGTQNMQKYPRNMLFSRALSNGVGWYCPDLFIGAVYTPEELGAEVDGEGNVLTVMTTQPLELKPANNEIITEIKTLPAAGQPVPTPEPIPLPSAEVRLTHDQHERFVCKVNLLLPKLSPASLDQMISEGWEELQGKAATAALVKELELQVKKDFYEGVLWKLMGMKAQVSPEFWTTLNIPADLKDATYDQARRWYEAATTHMDQELFKDKLRDELQTIEAKRQRDLGYLPEENKDQAELTF